MGKRKYQRVVLIVGLLFLTIMNCVIIYYQMAVKLQLDRNRIMGQLIVNHPELENDLIDAFENPKDKASQADITAGRALEEKYGYDNNSRGLVILKEYALIFSVVLISSLLLITSLLMRICYKQELQEQEDEKTKDQLKESQEAKQLLLERLTIEEKNMKELITDISHQLKTPLSSLKMNYEIAQSDDFTEEEHSTFLKEGQKEINKLEVLLETLLNLARLETNMIQIKPVTASLKKTLVEAVNRIYMKALNKNVTIEMKEFQDRDVIYDIRWTQEAFVNVLDNAVKYSDPGTTIRIKVIYMVTYAVIEIEDEGIGIPAKDYPNIFKRFYRGQSERVQKQEGSGVGLYLVRKILEEQGGSICVKKGVPCGSVFQITILQNC